MKGSQIQRLARTASLGRLEFGAQTLTLESDTKSLLAIFRGAYSVGCAIESWEGPPFCLTIDGEQFKGIVDLFGPDEEITLKATDANVQIAAAAGKAANLRATHSAEAWTYDPAALTADFGFTADGAALLEEMEIASLFLADPKRGLPVLQAARFEVRDTVDGQGELFVECANGVQSVYTSRLGLSGIGAAETGPSVAIVSPKDIALGLRIMEFAASGDRGGHVLVQYNAKHSRLTLSDAHGDLFYASEQSGEWPDLHSIIDDLGAVRTVSVAAGSLKTISTASAALRSGADIELAGAKNGGIVIRTVQSVDGAFALRDGTPEQQLTGTRLYPSEIMAAVSKLADQLEFAIPENTRKPTRVQAGARTLYLITKYQAG